MANVAPKLGRDLFGRKPRRPPPALERRTQIALADLLRRDARRDWFWTHIPSGELRTDATGALLKRMGLAPGLPDFLLISPQGRPHWLELKRGNLGVVTEDQDAFAEFCRVSGMPYALARSFDEAHSHFKAWGIMAGRAHVM